MARSNIRGAAAAAMMEWFTVGGGKSAAHHQKPPTFALATPKLIEHTPKKGLNCLELICNSYKKRYSYKLTEWRRRRLRDGRRGLAGPPYPDASHDRRPPIIWRRRGHR